jgi:hypothetical protein
MENAKGKIKGSVLEGKTKTPLEYATISLYSADDNKLITGTITDINVEIGQLVGPAKWVVQLADLSTFYIETSDLTELEVVKISENQAVEITPDALPDSLLQGRVESISQSFKTQAGDVVYTVKIDLLETDPSLMWGMTVEIMFLGE